MIRRGAFRADYPTTRIRVMLALPAGAAAGTVALILLDTLISQFRYPDVPEDWSFRLAALPSAFILFFVIQFFAICLYGLPIWLIMDGLRLRGWGASISAGALGALALMSLIMIAMFGWSGVVADAMPPPWRVGMLPISFVIGAAIGLAIWAVAYRRPKPAPAAKTVA